MATKAKEVKKEEDSKYRRMCENSSDCSFEKHTRVLSDMEVTSCTQCFHILSWNKISIDKKSTAPKSQVIGTADPVEEKPKSVTVKVHKPEIEAIVDAVPNVSIVTIEKDQSDTDKDAEKLREIFAGVDDIMDKVENNQVKTAEVSTAPEVAAVVDFDPFEDQEPVAAPSPKIGFFQIEKIMRKEVEVVRLILINETKTAKFIIDKETEKERADKIEARPDSMIGKYVKAEYFKLDEKGNPIDPVYISLAHNPS